MHQGEETAASQVRRVEFRVSTGEHGLTTVEPVLDGVALTDLVGAYERGLGYEPAGAYAGVVVPVPMAGRNLEEFFRGPTVRGWDAPSLVWLLACDCGEAGCWPLEAQVITTDETVTWSEFCQPHRPAWTYEDFGPIVLPRAEYDAALATATAHLARRSR